MSLGLMLPARGRWLLLCVLAGFFWSFFRASNALDGRLPSALEGMDLVAVGDVDGLPALTPGGWRFRFCPQRTELDGNPVDIAGCWRLAWHAERSRFHVDSAAGNSDGDLPVLEPGSRWRLVVRLRRPRGLVNPGGFDSERWALESGTTALGYVRDDPVNQPLAAGDGLHALRADIASWIEDALAGRARTAALLRGLAVGDRRDFRDEDWQVFRSTGTTHLFSISGLHVGMVAIAVAAIVAAATHAFPAALRLWPRRLWALVPALLAAVVYSALAGFEVPTQRSLAMIVLAGLVLCRRRTVGAWRGLCAAAAVVLLFDPLAMLGMGFWLSFLGVAWLLWSEQGRRSPAWWHAVPRSQAIITLGLLPLCAGFFGEASWVSLPANLIAIPWVTLVVVPLALLSLPAMSVAPDAAAHLLRIAGTLLDGLMYLLDAAAGWPGAATFLPAPGWLAIVAAVLALAVATAPLPMRLRLLALPLVLPLIGSFLVPAARLDHGTAELHVLDVGQGTSVLVRTAGHALLFDAGPGSADGFDAGESVVVPALRALGVERLDAMLLSHADNDHAGGATAVLRSLPVRRILLGEPVAGLAGEPCREGMKWHWDGVDFQLLHPPPRYPADGNDASCVLRIGAGGSGVLLPGDAGEVAEMRMRALHGGQLRNDVLVLGHHGSRTSTHADFLAAVQPLLAVATAGYRNRFGHPDPRVVRRLRHHGVVLAETARHGALRIRLGAGPLAWEGRRQRQRRFWHEP